MSIGQAIGTIIGAVLGLIICLVIHYWNKENEVTKEEELKPIDISKYNVTKSGNVVKGMTKCNECGKLCTTSEMTDDKRMCKDCYIKWLETDFVKMRTKELEKQLKAEHTRGEIDFVNMHCNSSCKKVMELEDKIKHLTQHLEPQSMSALFEQVEEEVKQKQRIEELKEQIEKMKQDLDNARENANKQEQWEIYSVLNDIYNDNFEVITSVSN